MRDFAAQERIDSVRTEVLGWAHPTYGLELKSILHPGTISSPNFNLFLFIFSEKTEFISNS